MQRKLFLGGGDRSNRTFNIALNDFVDAKEFAHCKQLLVVIELVSGPSVLQAIPVIKRVSRTPLFEFEFPASVTIVDTVNR